LIETGKLDATTALRWRGRLRSDPLPLPWGKRYEIDLDEVESSVGVTAVSGGLRLTYYKEGSPNTDPPAVRAGDFIEALVRARPAYNYGDPGSFDFRGYLACQNIQLQGTLRNGQLLTVVGPSRMTLFARFARIRGAFSIQLTICSRPTPRTERWRAPCCLEIEVSSTATARLIFRKQVCTTFWFWRDCMWARSRHFLFGPDADCAFRSSRVFY
jgi:hypothetical protein